MEPKNRKIYVVGTAESYANWMQGKLVYDMRDADLVVFTGGEDVDPSLYHEPLHATTSINKNRDREETLNFIRAKSLGKKIIGICRGSQFICVQAGGQLVQNQQNPHYIHPITTFDNNTIEITSSHHQAQLPYYLKDDEYKLIAWTENLSKYHQNGYNEEVKLLNNKEAEIVYYPKINALGIQGHPEWMNINEYPKTFEYLHDLLNKFMNDEL